jgi:hypothetical protein
MVTGTGELQDISIRSLPNRSGQFKDFLKWRPVAENIPGARVAASSGLGDQDKCSKLMRQGQIQRERAQMIAHVPGLD